LVERVFNQRDVENYFSALISILGYKPSTTQAEGRGSGRSSSAQPTSKRPKIMTGATQARHI